MQRAKPCLLAMYPALADFAHETHSLAHPLLDFSHLCLPPVYNDIERDDMHSSKSEPS